MADDHVPSPAVRRRAVLVAILSLAAAGAAMGMTGPLIALLLERRGAGATLIGLNSAMPALAVLALTLVLSRAVRALGAVPAMAGGLALWAVATLSMAVFDGLPAWFLLRFVQGLGLAIHWIVGEVWINTLAGERTRGRIVGAYVTASAGGYALGPALLPLSGLDGWAPFAAVAAVVGVAALPLAFAPGAGANPLPQRSATLAQVIALDPLVMMMALVAGFCDAALVSLWPVFGVARGVAWESTVILLAVLLAGNAALQVPIGWLADRLDRRASVLICAGVTLAGALLMPALIERPGFLMAVMFVWGGAEFGLYTLGLVRLGRRFNREELAGANAAFVLMYGVGTLLGPAATGSAMDLWGPIGLPAAIAAAAAFLMGVAVHHWFAPRRRVPRHPPAARREPPTPPPSATRDAIDRPEIPR